MEIIELVCGPLENNAYLLIEGVDAYLIDAPLGSLEAVDAELQKYDATLRAVLMTHGHWDHMGDLAAWQSRGVEVYAHGASRRFLEEPAVQSEYAIPGLRFEPAEIDREIEDGELLALSGVEAQVLHIPGHSQGSAVFYIAALGAAFVGDVIFRNSIGRTDLPGGNHAQLLAGIAEKLYVLPDATLLYPGHGPVTTVGYERQHNPFVKGV